MINLAGVKNVDDTILEELYLAGVKPIKIEKTNGEVPYSFIGKIGNWTLRRRWYYWSASVDDGNGLPLEIAMELHHRKNPINDNILGKTIRCGGHCGSPTPDEYGAQPIYNSNLYDKLEKLGYEKVYSESMDFEYVPITVGEISRLCNEGKLVIDRYVDSYHIDDQIGLNEFVKTIIKWEQNTNKQ